MKWAATVLNLEKCQPLFREFCAINGLHSGDSFYMTDYIFWANSLSLNEEREILEKYKMEAGND